MMKRNIVIVLVGVFGLFSVAIPGMAQTTPCENLNPGDLFQGQFVAAVGNAGGIIAGQGADNWCTHCPAQNELYTNAQPPLAPTCNPDALDSFIAKLNANKTTTLPMQKEYFADDWCDVCRAHHTNNSTPTNPGDPSLVLDGGDTSVTPGNSGDEFNRLRNPLGGGGIDSLEGVIKRILEIVLMIGIPLEVLAIIWAGFSYVKAQGQPEKIKAAHSRLLWTIIGGALLIGAFAIAQSIQETVEEIVAPTAQVMDVDWHV